MRRRNLRLHEHELTKTLMPVMNAFVIARASAKHTAEHLLKDNRPRLHNATIVAHACPGLVGAGVIVCEMCSATADAKKMIARSVCRTRIESKHSTIIISEGLVHFALLCVGRHFIIPYHCELGKRH